MSANSSSPMRFFDVSMFFEEVILAMNIFSPENYDFYHLNQDILFPRIF